ncbi:TIGR03621 family F420-dependent LLM class oxidoreductase [Nocardia sp. NPDC051570]|uniref:TIGR03621 family F420-dependent LLM class oxidoreductase n=1 Tax=Nocardia sp. NPDC051570 TaxID=3364324 RepID=UPI0037B60C84
MTSRPIRVGLSLFGQGSVASLTEDARRAEQIGVDVVLLPDHLGFTAPLPPLVAIAQAAPTLRVSNLVLNAAFYRPALLARDLASVDSATNGRLEIGLGTGYVEEEFTAAGLPFPRAGERVDLLTEHVTEIKRLLSSPDHIPAPVQTPPPIMVAGVGDRVLAMAAEHADIVAIATMGNRDDLAERIEYVETKAGDRFDEIELAFSFFQASIDDPDDLSILRMLAPGRSDADLRRTATFLGDSIAEAADRIRSLREELGISYFTFSLAPGLSWDTLEKLVAELK